VHVLNDPWPWWGTLHGQPLSLPDLINRKTLTAELIAVLAWTIAHGASVFTVAGPQGAGKSTVANALLELLPDTAQVYVTSGPRDRLDLPSLASPTYLLINELSGHMSVYLHGPAVGRAFGLLKSGVRMLGTLHARSAAEAASILYAEAELPPAELKTPFVFVVVAAHWQGQDIVRRVTELGFLSPGGELTVLTTRSSLGTQTLNHLGVAALAAWTAIPASEIESDLGQRAAIWA
jgi:type IV secretory pathway ATPase VirB11/archaellum biosynthesis ATPase